jgi:hypothetical protein
MAALVLAIVSVMKIVLTAAAGNPAVPTHRIVARRLLYTQRRLRVFVRCPRPTLADTCLRLGRSGHVYFPWSTILLIALVRRVLLDVALMVLLIRIFGTTATLLDLVRITGLRIACSHVTLVLGWDGWRLGHTLLR